LETANDTTTIAIRVSQWLALLDGANRQFRFWIFSAMFICADTEDDSKELMEAGESGFKKQVTQITAIAKSGKRFHNEGDVKEFLHWLCEQPERFIYFNNTQYDLGNLFGDCLDALDCTLVGGRLIKAVWGQKIFLDVFNLYQMSVEKLGKSFGLAKLKTDDMAKDKAYAMRDTEIIFRAVDFAWEFANELGLKAAPNTIGSFSVKAWKAQGGVNVHDTNPLSKEAYFGGRVELFKHRNESNKIAYTDINSLYPSALLNEFPCELIEWTEKDLPAFGIAKVRVKSPKRDLGILPYRNEDGRILYPYGEFTGIWTILEIKAALQRGYKLVDTIEVWGTNESIRPYKEYMLTCYEKRLAADNEATKLFFKLLMNSFYGRLGTGGVIGRTVYQTEENAEDGICFGEKVLVNYQMPLSKETNWAHAAYVTAYGRLRLLEFIEKIGVDAMIYCDTDSCIFDCSNGKIPFECSKELGQMKLEGWGTACETYAPKMYKTNTGGEMDFKAKGVPKRLAQAFIEQGRVDFDLPFKLRESIAFFDRDNAKKLSVWRNVSKVLHGKYDKKILRGNRYFPCKVIDN
jgi:hypothetical protein